MIARYLQPPGYITQHLSPIPPLLLQVLPNKPLPLPLRIVRVLNFQLRKRIAATLAVRLIQLPQLCEQNTHRPPIRYYVMHRDQQHVLLRPQPDQPTTDQRTPAEVKLLAAFLSNQLSQLLLCLPLLLTLALSKILLQQGKALRLRPDLLIHLGPSHHKSRPQTLMASDNPVQRCTQGRPVEGADQPQTTGYVIRSADSFPLRQKPQPLLCK